jgi:hypothetical protein
VKHKQGQLKRGWRDDIKEAMEERNLTEKKVIEVKRGDWEWRNGNTCKIIHKYIHIFLDQVINY